MTVRHWLAALLLALGGAATAQVVGGRGAELPLDAVVTPHFTVVHPPRLQAYARHVAAAAEAIHDRVVGRVGQDPGRTFILVNDETDVFNGYALADPQPFVRVYATFPRPTDIGAQWEDSLVALVGHEFTHVADLTVRDDLRRAARGIFGPAPGILGARVPPPWLLEGYAVYLETELTAGGRGRDATVATLRAQVARYGQWPTLAEASTGPLERYPYGNTRYAFGAGFVPFLVSRAGESGLRRAVQEYNGLQPDFASAWQAANGTSLYDLWDEWTAAEQARAEQELEALRASRLPAGRPLQGSGASRPSLRPDGTLAYWQAGALHFQAPPGAVPDFPEAVPLPYRPDRLSWAPDGSLVYARLTAEGARTVGEVYRLGRDGKEQRQPAASRARDASADGQCILYVQDDTTASRLRRLCGSEDAVLFTAPADAHLSTPARGPDGRIALTVWRPGGFLDIALLAGGRLDFVTSDAAQDMEPAWTADGRLLFTSDRSGSFQLHEATTAGLVQLSAAPGGVYAPAAARQGVVAYSTYGGDGVEAHALDLPGAGRPAAVTRAEPAPLSLPDGSAYPVVPYDAPLTAFWGPAGPTGPGATVVASDPAGVHSLYFSAGYSLSNLAPEAFASYTLTPALDWQASLSAALDAGEFSAFLSAANAGEAEAGGRVVEYRATLGAGWVTGRPLVSAGLRLDSLSEDEFGYPDEGWSLAAGASSAPDFSLAARFVDPTAGLPLVVDASLSRSASLVARLQLGTRYSLPLHERLGDGVIGLERLTLAPYLRGAYAEDVPSWGAGTLVAFDASLHYFIPVTLGLQLDYGSREGFSIRLVGLSPFLDLLSLGQKSGASAASASLDSPGKHLP